MIPPIHSSNSGVLPSAAVVTPSSRPMHDSIIDLYAVQRCWYSSPHVTPTVDYLRLLRTPQDAEQIAYHSAHLWAASNGTAPVRTITLPAHPSFHAFVAAGQVFWIRRVRAMVAGQNNNNNEAWDHAHCILSHGILGGGSHGSVRRREVDTADAIRIFVGPQSAHRALQLISGNAVPPGSTVQWVPVGAPPTVHHIPNEWPPASPTKSTDDDMMILPDAHHMAPSDKRTLEENDMNNTVWYSSHRSARPKNTDPFVASWQAPPSTTSWESRPHKRPCRATEAVPSSPPSHSMME